MVVETEHKPCKTNNMWLTQVILSDILTTFSEERIYRERGITMTNAANKINKVCSVVGALVGVILIIVGCIFALNSGSRLHTVGGGQPVEFGADFYTYQYRASVDITTNTATTARNSYAMVNNLALYFGVAFIAWGVLTVLKYGKDFVLCLGEGSVAAAASDKSAEPEVENAAPNCDLV